MALNEFIVVLYNERIVYVNFLGYDEFRNAPYVNRQ